jgi:hypothetical protein
MASATPESPALASVVTVRRAATHPAVDFLAILGICLCCAELGLWFAPFVLGVGIGAFKRRYRGVVLLTAAGAVAGWAGALWLMAHDSLPVGATARTIAALAGLPPYAGVAIAVTLLLAALQALAGTWLARAVLPRQLRIPVNMGRGSGPSGDRLRPEATSPLSDLQAPPDVS